MAYRACVLGTEVLGNGNVKLDSWIEKTAEVEGETVWVRMATHRDIVLPSAQVQPILSNESLTDGQKRAALADLLRDEVVSWGIHNADEANTGIEDLVTFPVYVPL